MLIDAAQREETRVVISENGRVEAFDFEDARARSLRGNIYLARVVRVEPALQAAFVDYGGNRNGFLAFGDIHEDYYRPVADAADNPDEALPYGKPAASNPDQLQPAFLSAGSTGNSNSDPECLTASTSGSSDDEIIEPLPVGRYLSEDMDNLDTLSSYPEQADPPISEHVECDVPTSAELDRPSGVGAGSPPARGRRHLKIQDVIQLHQVMLVQISKEERGNKGAALTTAISLPGRYCILMPNSKHGGISRKIVSTAARRQLKEIVAELGVPSGMSVIVRTAGLSRTRVEIQRDYSYLTRLWGNIRSQFLHAVAPAPVYKEGDVVKRALRDLYTHDINEIIVAGPKAYHSAREQMQLLMPSHSGKIHLYQDQGLPLFRYYKVEEQLEAMYDPQVRLKSGGSIVINPTEALVAIDVNSGRSTCEHDIEGTALKTNLEAAEEIARQLRIRNLGGLIVVDFIDMGDPQNNYAVERCFKEALLADRARSHVGKISQLGLLEMSRQRPRASPIDNHFERCPHCQGMGVVRSVKSSALGALRTIEEYLAADPSAQRYFVASLPGEVMAHILSHKRTDLAYIEERQRCKVMFRVDGSQNGVLVRRASGAEIRECEGVRQPAAITDHSLSDSLPPVTQDEPELPSLDDQIDTPRPVAKSSAGRKKDNRERRPRPANHRKARSGPGEVSDGEADFPQAEKNRPPQRTKTPTESERAKSASSPKRAKAHAARAVSSAHEKPQVEVSVSDSSRFNQVTDQPEASAIAEQSAVEQTQALQPQAAESADSAETPKSPNGNRAYQTEVAIGTQAERPLPTDQGQSQPEPRPARRGWWNRDSR